MKFSIISIIILFFCSCSHNDLESKAKEAELEFSKGNLEQALQFYKDLEARGVRNSFIFQRMSNCTDDIGLKVYYLKKSIHMNCDECIDQLRKIREEIKFNPVATAEPLLSNNARSSLILAFSLLLGISIISYNFVKIEIFLFGAIPSTLILIWLTLGTQCNTDFPNEIENCLIRGINYKIKEAVVVNDNVFALSEAEEQSQAVLALPKGAELQITTKSDKWAQVKLPNNRTGWIMLENIKLI